MPSPTPSTPALAPTPVSASAPDVSYWLHEATRTLVSQRLEAHAVGAGVWRERLERELLRHFIDDFGISEAIARADVQEAVAGSVDPEGLLEELVLRARLLVAFGETSLEG